MSGVVGACFARSQPRPRRLPTEPIWRLSVDKYHEMIQAGILTEDDPVELLEGWLVEKMPKNAAAHPGHTDSPGRLWSGSSPPGWFVNAQEPVTTTDSEPEPDASVRAGRPAPISDRHPGPLEVALVVEVSAATLRRDRTTKLRIYARGVDSRLLDRQPHRQPRRGVHRPDRPGGPAVLSATPRLRPGRRRCLLSSTGQEIGRIAVRDILP